MIYRFDKGLGKNVESHYFCESCEKMRALDLNDSLNKNLSEELSNSSSEPKEYILDLSKESFKHSSESIAFFGPSLAYIGGNNWRSVKNIKYAKVLRSLFVKGIENYNIKYILVDGNSSSSQMAFDIAYKLKNKYDLKIVYVLAYKNIYQSYSKIAHDKFKEQISKADKIICVDEKKGYQTTTNIGGPGILKDHMKNMYMLDSSSIAIVADYSPFPDDKLSRLFHQNEEDYKKTIWYTSQIDK